MSDSNNILVLGVENSCRSQMAAGFLKHYAGSQFKIHSAGIAPAQELHPLTIQVMKEDGIEFEDEKPKPTPLSEYQGQLLIRYMIVVSERAKENLPTPFPGLTNRLDWPFLELASFEGTEAETLTVFRKVRDEIRTKILAWLQTEGTR